MNPATVTFRIFRLRADNPGEAGFDEFTLGVGRRTTVLDVLEEICFNRDPSLIFQHSCHHGACGRCACRINGTERLACLTKVSELGTETVTVEPLNNSSSIGDVADWPRALFDELDAEWSCQRPSEWHPEARPPDELGRFARFESCIECGACLSACPAAQSFAGPAAMAALNRERRNKPEKEQELLRRAAGPRGQSGCRRALDCSRVCPTGVAPARHIMELRRALGADAEAPSP